MANPKWFDDNVYMNNKLAQLKATDADTYGSWDMYQLENAFTEAGFGGAEGAYAHFNEYGNSKDENISPNANFIPSQYYVFKAAALYHDGDVNAVTSVESAYVASAIKDAGMSAWQHYIDFGTKEGINPSNNFDTAKYLEAKAAALNAQSGTTEWTADKVADAFKAANMNALSHAMQYADGSAGEAAAAFDSNGKPTGAYAVENKISGGDAGQTFTLTQDIDDFTGTDGDDVFIGNLDGARVTIQSGDKINGGEGEDTFEIYGGFGTMPSNISSIEVFKIDEPANADVNLASYTKASTGLEKVIINNASALNGKTITTGDDQTLSLSTGANNGGTAGAVTWHTSDTATAASMTLAGYQGNSNATVAANALTVQGAKLATLNVESTGAANRVTTLTLSNATENLVLTGDQNFTVATNLTNAAGTGTTLKSIDATAMTANVNITETAATNAAFTYKGGSGKDTLTLSSLTAIKDGAQLDGGTGDNDTLIVGDAFAANSTALYAKTNAVTGFEALGFSAASVVDASKITNEGFAKHFVDAGNTAGILDIQKLAADSVIDVLGTNGSLTLSGGDSVRSATINLGTDTSTGVNETATTVTGLRTVTVTSNGDGTGVNSLGAVTNTAGAAFTVSGSNALTITSLSAAGDVDASGLTGNLTLGALTIGAAAGQTRMTNGLEVGDGIIKAGSGNNVIVTDVSKTATQANNYIELASGSGEDSVGLVSATGAYAVATTGTTATIKNFEAGKDHLYIATTDNTALGAAASLGTGTSVTAAGATVTKGIVSASTITSANTFLASLVGGTAAVNAGVAYTDGTDTYVAMGTAAGASDYIVVKLAGVVATELVADGDGFMVN